jgi:hypothetical protein
MPKILAPGGEKSNAGISDWLLLFSVETTDVRKRIQLGR